MLAKLIWREAVKGFAVHLEPLKCWCVIFIFVNTPPHVGKRMWPPPSHPVFCKLFQLSQAHSFISIVHFFQRHAKAWRALGIQSFVVLSFQPAILYVFILAPKLANSSTSSMSSPFILTGFWDVAFNHRCFVLHVFTFSTSYVFALYVTSSVLVCMPLWQCTSRKM